MFGLPVFLMSRQQQKMLNERRKRYVEHRVATAVPWSPEVRWQPELTFQAKTFKVLSLFDVKPCASSDVNDAELKQTVHSPTRRFCYCEKRLKRGDMLQTMYGGKTGTVMFDGPVIVPCLHGRSLLGFESWEHAPWMSLTPMEMLTLRSGTRRAKGRVIVAGLGLGHQLIEVSKRKQVKELILLEKSQELVDWLLPRIRPYLARDLTDVVVGDAKKVLRKMKADVALIDIFEKYGGNTFTEWVPVSPRLNEERPIPTPGIKSVWCWGSAETRS